MKRKHIVALACSLAAALAAGKIVMRITSGHSASVGGNSSAPIATGENAVSAAGAIASPVVTGDHSVGANGPINAPVVTGDNNTIEWPYAEPQAFMLLPDKRPTPPLAQRHSAAPHSMVVLLGENGAAIVSNKGGADHFNVFAIDGKPILGVERISGEGLKLSANFIRADGTRLLTIVANKVDPNVEGLYLDVQRISPHAVRVVDAAGEEVLFADFVNETTFVLRAHFFVPGRGWLTASDQGVSLAGNTIGPGGTVNLSGCSRLGRPDGICSAFEFGENPHYRAAFGL